MHSAKQKQTAVVLLVQSVYWFVSFSIANTIDDPFEDHLLDVLFVMRIIEIQFFSQTTIHILNWQNKKKMGEKFIGYYWYNHTVNDSGYK